MDSPIEESSCHLIDGWRLHEFGTLPSTNPVAGALPAWHAVRANLQTGGRGRTGRAWISNAGGLWISAVLPAPGPRKKWSILPLGAGWAMIEALREIGVEGLRLRWPNDILAGRRKLAGLLVEQYQPETVVIGLGLNLTNRPGEADPALDASTIGLAELAPRSPSIDEAARMALGAFRRLQSLVEQDRFPEIARDINARWGEARLVELTLNGRSEPVSGYFRGVDPEGRLDFMEHGGGPLLIEAAQVALLREV